MTIAITGIEEAVRQAVRDELAQAREDEPTGYLSVKSAAAYLDTTEDAIRALVKRAAIPVRRTPQGRLLFVRADLDAWLR